MEKPRKSKRTDYAIAIKPLPEKVLKRRNEYYLALGSFVNAFSLIEAEIILTLCYFAKVDKKTAKALFSGVRIEQAADFLRRLGAVKKIKPDIFAELNQNLLPQIKAIADLRNDIIHYGIDFRRGRLTVDNQKGVGRTQVRRYTVSAKLLEMARMDLGRIILRLNMILSGENPASLPTLFRETLFGPWKYKSRATRQKSPRSGRKRNPAKQKAQLHRPAASTP